MPQSAFLEIAGVSGDGRVVFGSLDQYAFRWTTANGLQQLAPMASNNYAYAADFDGSTIVGSVHVSTMGRQAMRWTSATGAVALAPVPGYEGGVARGVSHDGLVVVGTSTGTPDGVAFRWTEATGAVALGTVPGYVTSAAYATNRDGNVIVGDVTATGFGATAAFRWTAESGMQALSGAPAGWVSNARAVSADGRVVVGSFRLPSIGVRYLPMRWTAETGMVSLYVRNSLSLKSVGGRVAVLDEGYATAVNADGTVIVGSLYAPFAVVGGAFRWTESDGLQLVSDWLSAEGVDTGGWTLSAATGVSADGKVIVGYASTPQNPSDTFIAFIGDDGTGLIGMDSFGESLASTQVIGSGGATLTSLAMNGAHHRPLLHDDLNKDGHCLWVSGDLAHYSDDSNADAGLAEGGLCTDVVGKNMRLGVGVGKSFVSQDLAFSGSARTDGEYLLGELDYEISDGLIASALVLYGRWHADVERAYPNGAQLDISRGRARLSSWALRARLDWLDAARFGRFSLSPRISMSHSRSFVKAYRETGGALPARYDSREHRASEVRFGVDGATPLGAHTRLSVSVEGVHRFDDQIGAVSGDASGLFTFSFAGRKVRRRWLRAGVEIGYRPADDVVLRASVNAATPGEDPELSAGVHLQVVF